MELAVPLKTKEAVIGVLAVSSDRLNAFDETDLVVLQSLATQAAIAIENARLFDAEQRRAEQFWVISAVGRHITSLLDIDEVLVQVVRLIQNAFLRFAWRAMRPSRGALRPRSSMPPMKLRSQPSSQALSASLISP